MEEIMSSRDCVCRPVVLAYENDDRLARICCIIVSISIQGER